jgi:hypothetical protein
MYWDVADEISLSYAVKYHFCTRNENITQTTFVSCSQPCVQKTIKPFSREENTLPLNFFWNAKVLLKTIKSQLNVSESILSRVLAFAKNIPETLVTCNKPGSERPAVINKNIQKALKRKLILAPNTITMQIKKTVSGLAHVSVTARQHVSLKKLKLPSRVMVNKPILTQRIKIRD